MSLRKFGLPWLLAVGVFLAAFPARADLKSYVASPDASYGYKIVETEEIDGLSVTTIRLTSQTWQGIVWEHWLTILRPAVVEHPQGALL
ncbi:MAG: hypothetical protein JNK74_30195, partial [Candidatus Hydrogenedentes bacterium]|nr:hypothetical protein [Candidatus Hydrogenedentota bacterium]